MAVAIVPRIFIEADAFFSLWSGAYLGRPSFKRCASSLANDFAIFAGPRSASRRDLLFLLLAWVVLSSSEPTLGWLSSLHSPPSIQRPKPLELKLATDEFNPFD
jgi:hypothetical protein